MQDKRDVKCSFCDVMINTTFSAVICPKCEKTMYSINCPGCGLPLNSTPIKEHNRLWHEGCYKLFSVDKTAEDSQDYDSNVETKSKKTRKILTGNGTYLFYNDSDAYTSMYSHLLSRKESVILSRRKTASGVYTSHNDPIPSSFLEDDNLEEFSPHYYEDEMSVTSPNFFSTNRRQIIFRMQTLGYIKEQENNANDIIYTTTGEDVVNFMTTRNNCKSREEARTIGQNLIDLKILIPSDQGEEVEEPVKFDEETLYIVQEPEQEMEQVEISSPLENEIDSLSAMKDEEYIPKSGYLTLLTKLSTGVSTSSQSDGKSERVLCKLTGGNLQMYSTTNGKLIEVFDLHEFEVRRDMSQKSVFELSGAVRKIRLMADSEEECKDWVTNCTV